MSAGFYEWQPASGNPRVFIGCRAMDEIKAHVIRGFKSLPKRGAEIGGVLLGSRDAQSGQIIVEGFEPIEIEYHYGPSYILSEADYARWNDWIRALRESSPRIVGICRSQTRPGLRVAPEDTDLIQQLMPGGDGVFLIVKPLSERECVASFFPFLNGVVVDGTTSSREFPFGAALATPAPAPLVPGQKPARQPISRWTLITAVAAGIGAAGALHYLTGSRAESPVPTEVYPINSSSDGRQTKPSAAAPSSAATGESAIKSQGRTRAARAPGGTTRKASHPWPSHSVKQAQPTQ